MHDLIDYSKNQYIGEERTIIDFLLWEICLAASTPPGGSAV